MMWKRVATAAVLIPIVVAVVLFLSTAVLSLVIGLVTLVALFEYFALGESIGHRGYRFWTATCAIVLVYVQWLAVVQPVYQVSGGLVLHRAMGRALSPIPTAIDVFFLFILGIAALSLWNRRPVVEGLPAAGISSSALLLVAFPLSFAVRLHGIVGLGPWLLLFTLVLIWVGDTVAFFVGRLIGRHALAPRLSPKKTWEGAIASFAGSLLVGVLFSRRLTIAAPEILGLAAAGNLAGQIGDLLESAYKRSAGAKDSGSLLPGHGGLLDRIDALILAIPVVWYYWVWFCSPRT